MLLSTDAQLTDVLSRHRSVAVLGAKNDAFEAAFYVPQYLAARGYSVTGVNPKLAGTPWLGRPAVAQLADLTAPVELIEVFRRSDSLVPIAQEIVALPWQPAVVWFQLGIANAEAAKILIDRGISVVENRCMMPEHRRLIG
jgi:predicted CoA-binding protein